MSEHSSSPAWARDALIGVVLDAIQTPVFFKDRAGRFLGCNRAYEDFSGIRRDDLVGRSVFDLYPRDVADRYEAADVELYAHGPSQIYEAPGVRADGLRRDLVVYKAVFRGAHGEVAGLVGTMLDVTERRTAERALSEANETLEARVDERTRELARSLQVLSAILESSADGILAVDGDGRVLARNERFADVWGIPHEIASSGDDERLLAAVAGALEDPTEFRRRVDELYASPETEAFDVIGLRDGRTIERYSVPMELGGARPGRVWSFRDVTERSRATARERQLELEMRHAQKLEAVGRLAGGVAHDFNNLLTVMTTCAGLAAATLEEDHPAHAEVAEIQQAVERASRLTHQLLAFSRKQVLLPRILDLNEIVEGVEKMLRRLLGEDVEIAVQAAADLRSIEADPGQVEQVIANLCVNARDAMPRGGRITLGTRQHVATAAAATASGVSAMRARPHAELWISDTGVGMDDATREQIFEPFFTTKERGKGTGLGLSTVYGIVQQSGGEIEVESALGAGSTFRVFFPSVEPVVEPPTLAHRGRAAEGGTESVLLVEDEDAVRRVIARQLELCGYRVVQACDGEEAVDVATRRAEPFDLLLTDLVMPRRSGLEAAGALRAAGKVTRVLFMSGFSDESSRMPADAALLRKPFSGEMLLQAVRDALDDRALRDS